LYFALRRADILLLNKINFIHPDKLSRLKKLFMLLKPSHVPLIEMKTEIADFTDLRTGEKLMFKDLQSEPVILACAIARPEQFLKLVQDGGIKIASHLFLPDHAPYTLSVIEQLDQLVRSHQAKYILVTEKDAVKLRDLKLRSRVLVSELKISSKELVDAISARLSR
jgi:tetraacyldisaccharide 4'-kinase